MAWWRRDPNLIYRSPIHRYAQRILRDDQAALRARCFSRSPSKSAQFQDDGGKRPEGMSNLEWMQLQHYRRWTKRLRDNPYQAIFGASNDMLNGKGLKDWEWVHKSFPKWMLRDMDISEAPNKDNVQDGNPKRQARSSSERTTSSMENNTTTKFGYPRRVNIVKEDDHEIKMPNPFSLQQSTKASDFEKNASSGIASPSDLRRPREVLNEKAAGQSHFHQSGTLTELSEVKNTLKTPPSVGIVKEIPHQPQSGLDRFGLDAFLTADPSLIKKEAAARESSFIQAFLEDWPEEKNVSASKNTNVKSWRQTALQRRRPSISMSKPEGDTPKTMITRLSSQDQPVPIPSSQASNIIFNSLASEARSKPGRWPDDAQNCTKTVTGDLKNYPQPVRSASQIVKSLPSEDIDFLSAADIRSAMGSKRSKLPSNEERQAQRQLMEQNFADVNGKMRQLESMVEAQIVNNQQIRRKERELREQQRVTGYKDSQVTDEVSTEASGTEMPAESSIARMKTWLETTGASFVKQFWQDPTEAEDITKSRMFFDKAYHYIRKGRTAMRPIVDDLEKDIPVCKPLLIRLGQDEERLELAVHRLRQRSQNGSAQRLTPRKIRAMESIRSKFQQTNDEVEKAFSGLRELAHTGEPTKAPDSFKRRLTMASKVLHKNTQLSRMLIYSLQARLEDPNMDRGVLPNYKVVADDLLSLRDTQMSLMRLVDYAILVYSASPQNAHLGSTECLEHQEFEACEDPFVRARLAADAHLIDEIKAHKSAKTPSSDKLEAPNKSTPSFTLDEPKFLAHSLFRPFAPAFEKLGTIDEDKIAAQKARDDAEKKAHDVGLVADIKKAYEDSYGAITVDHRQISLESIPLETGVAATTKSFEMLKEDPGAQISTEMSGDITNPRSSEVKVAETSGQVPQIGSLASQDFSANSFPVNKDIDSSTVPAVSSSVPEDTIAPEILKDSDSPTTITARSAPFTSSSAKDPSDTVPKERPATSESRLLTHYTILIHDPNADNLTITTSTSDSPRDTSPSVPIHEALATLDSPGKFVPYITEGLEVVSAKKDMLVLRNSFDPEASTRGFETVSAPPTYSKIEDFMAPKTTVNPIDGTARLSPTGYVGPEESEEQLEKEFKERREAAGKLQGKRTNYSEASSRQGKGKKRSSSGIVKTAIWATALCYVVGVFGEIATSPFKG